MSMTKPVDGFTMTFTGADFSLAKNPLVPLYLTEMEWIPTLKAPVVNGVLYSTSVNPSISSSPSK